jgi:hypothetical protein
MGGAIVIRQMKALLSLDAAGFDKGLDGAESRLDRFGQKMRSWGASMTAAVTLPLIAAGTAFVKWASDVQEATSAATQVYGAGADAIIAKSKEAAETVFLSEGDYLAAAATLGVYGKAAGLTGDELAAFGHSNIQAAADLASFYNISGGVPAVLEAIQGALMGEYDALQRMGVLIDETIVNDYAWSHGIAEVGAELTEQQKVLARHGVIMEGLGPAQGDAARTAGGLANQIRKLQAQFKNIGATIGKILLPVAMKLVGVVADLFSWAEKISPSMLKWAVIIAAVVAAIGPLLFALGVFAPGLALLLSPIGLVVAALAGLAVVFRGPLGDAIRGAVADFKLLRDVGVGPIEAAFFAVGLALDSLLGTDIANRLRGWGETVQQVFDGIVDSVRTFFDVGFDEAVGVLAANIQAAFGNETLTSAVVNGIQFLKNLFTGEWAAAWEDFKDFSHDVGKLTLSGVLALGGMIGEWAGNIWGWIKRELGIGAMAGDASGGPLMDTAPIALGDVLIDGALKLGGALLSGAWSIGGELADLVGRAIGAVNWGQVIRTAADFGAALRGWYDDALDAVDWGNLGFEIGQRIGSLAGTLIEKGRELIGGIVTAIREDPEAVGRAVLGVILAVPAAVGYVGMTLAAKGAEFIGGLIEGAAGLERGTLTNFFKGLPGRIVGMIGDLANTLWDKGSSLLSGLWNGATSAWDNVVIPGAQGIATAIPGLVGDLSRVLYDKGRELIQGMWDGAVAVWDEFTAWLTGRGADVAGAPTVATDPNANPTYPEGVRPVFPGAGGGTAMPLVGGNADGGRFRQLAESAVIPAPDFSAFDAAWQVAGALVTNVTLAIESRVTAMAGVVTAMAFNAGDGALAGLQQGFDAAAALVTNVTLGLEARLTGFAGVATAMGFNAGDGWDAGVAQGMQAGGAVVTNVTLGLESRLTAFAGAATVAGFNAGDGFFAGIDQGMGRAVGAAESGAGQITGALSFDLSGEGYWIGASLAQGIASGINGWAVVVANAAYAIVAGAIAAARLAGGIFSPSRPMGYIGDMLMAGLFAPIRDGQAEMSRLMGGVLGAATGAPVPGFAPRLAPMGALSGLGGRSEQRPVVNNYYISDNVIGDDAEAWIARVSVRSVVPAVGKALDQERRAQGMR